MIQTKSTQEQFNEQVQALEAGEKYTVVGFNDFGFPVVMQFTLQKTITEKPKYGYMDKVYIVYKAKGKRTAYRKCFDKDVVIWKGWNKPLVDMFTPNQYGELESKMCFDNGYIKVALNSIKENPVVYVPSI